MSDIKISTPVEEVINDIRCLSFGLVAHLSTGFYILGSEPGTIGSVETKQGMIDSFDFIIERLKDSTDILSRQQWEDANLICIHIPIDSAGIQNFTSPSIGAQSLFLDFGFIQQMGIPVSEEILKLKAFNLKEDVIAQADLSRQEKPADIDLG